MTPRYRFFFIITLAISGLTPRQGKAERDFPVPPPPHDVTIAAVPGVIAAGAKWEPVWQGRENADGLIGYKGGILFAQEQTNHVMRLDEKGRVSIFASASGPGALAIAPPQDAVYAVERSCTDPGGQPDLCHDPSDIAIVYPAHVVLANAIDKVPFGRLNDIVADKKGGLYFTDGPGPGGKAYFRTKYFEVVIGENIHPNGIMLSRDDKILYVTNGPSIVAFDVLKNGAGANQREFAKLQYGANGDGMAIDEEGRIYDATAPGVQVFSPQGQFLGLIPTPRSSISIAFSGPGKKVLYAACLGALGPDGKEITTRPGIRNTAMTVYKIQMEAAGYHGRPK